MADVEHYRCPRYRDPKRDSRPAHGAAGLTSLLFLTPSHAPHGCQQSTVTPFPTLL